MKRSDFIELARQAAWAAHGPELRGAVARGWAALWDGAPRHLRRHVEEAVRKEGGDRPTGPATRRDGRPGV